MISKEILNNLFEKAWLESTKSQCLKKKVGAVLYDTHLGVIIGRGFGGAKETCPECVRKTLEWQQDGCWSVHSELRALFDALMNYHRMEKEALVGILKGNREEVSSTFPTMNSLKNSVAVVTHGPCDQCLKYLHFFGCPLVVFDTPYHNDYSKWNGKIEIRGRNDEPVL